MALKCTPRTFTKTIINVTADWKSTENTSLVFSKNASLEFIHCNFIHLIRTPPQGLSGMGSARYQGTYLELSLFFFYTGGYNSTERTRTIQLGLDIYNCVTGNFFIWMPMLMLLPMPRCRCWDFQMVFFINFSGTTYFVELSNGCF